jgi:hypothetical protein
VPWVRAAVQALHTHRREVSSVPCAPTYLGTCLSCTADMSAVHAYVRAHVSFVPYVHGHVST